MIAETWEIELREENARLREVVEHIAVMADDAYLIGHPEWEAIVEQAKAVLAKVKGA